MTRQASPGRRGASSATGLLRVALAAALLGAACGHAPDPLPPAPAPTPTVVTPVSLPRDAGPHDVLTEWWYFTGHLRAAGDQREYGFEYTVFQLRRAGAPTGYLAHFAVTDVAGRRFSHQARFAAGEPQAGRELDVQGWRLTNDGPADAIDAAMQPGAGAEPPFALRLRLADRKPPALHHGGYIDYGPPGGSYYYSRTRLAVSGELREAEAAWAPVTGQAWMDHQWGNFLVAGAGGWDWYSVQLDDDTELMLYLLRSPTGETSAVYGTRVLADGTARELAPGAVRVEATGQWTSPHTGGVYPSGWRIELPEQQLRLVLAPVLRDQELYFPELAERAASDPAAASFGNLAYWEGAVEVRSEGGAPGPRGTGYVELTGYATRQ